MNVFNKIRDLFGVKSDVDTSELAQLRTLRLEQWQVGEHLSKAQDEFDRLNLELDLQVQACEQLLEKAESVTVSDNRTHLKSRQTRLASSFLDQRQNLVVRHRGLGEQVEELEGSILAKAVELTAELEPDEQDLVKATLVEWHQTGMVGDEMIVSQVEAIALVLEEVVIKGGGEGSKGGHIIGHTSSGKPIYSKFAHEGHKNFSTEDHDDAKHLQRERATSQSDPVRSSNIAQQAAKHSTAANTNRRDAAQKEKEAKPGYAEKSKRLKELHTAMEAVPKLHGGLVAHTHQKEWDKLHKEYNEIHADIHKADDHQPITLEQAELLEKASPEQKKKVRKVMDEWKSGKLKSSSGDKVGGQKQAIAIALSEAGLSKSEDEDEIEKSHNSATISANHGGSGSASAVVYDSPVEGHYANALVKMNVNGVEKILFLKRATNKTVAPGQYCLPGGHIEAGETISQAALRELKEEANLTATYGYVLGKAKCDDGKWCFYCEVYPENPAALALLDGESMNAHWMTREEWIKADLFFDLKEHLVALTTQEQSIANIRDIMHPEVQKAEDVQELYLFTDPEHEEELNKAGGEGSRGGKVLGHTRSGKPVYINFDHPSHQHFSDDDHMEASGIHKKMIGEQRTAQDVNVHAFAALDHVQSTSQYKKFKEALGKSEHKHAMGTKLRVRIPRPMNQNKFDEHHITVDAHDTDPDGKPMYGGKTDKGKHRWFQDEHVIG